MPEDKEEKGLGLDFTSIYLGVAMGIVLAQILDGGRSKREKEKIRRHLERALDEVDD